MIKEIQATLANMVDKIPGVLAAAVVTINDGLSIAEECRREGIDSAAASAYLASIVKSNLKAIKLLAGDQVTDDILITTNDYYFIIRQLPAQPIFLFLMTSRDSWLGRARIIMREYDEQFQRLGEFLAKDYVD